MCFLGARRGGESTPPRTLGFFEGFSTAKAQRRVAPGAGSAMGSAASDTAAPRPSSTTAASIVAASCAAPAPKRTPSARSASSDLRCASARAEER